MTRKTIREFVEMFESGIFDDPDVRVQIEAGWYDWFCSEAALARKTKALGKKVVQLSKSPLIDIDTHYVFFKNNCPLSGNLYDSFSICAIEDGEVQYWITPACGHSGQTHGKPQVSSNGNAKKVVDSYFENWRAVKKFFEV